MESALDYYRRVREREAARRATLTARYERLALVRLAVFLGWIAGLIVLFSTNGRWGLAAFVVSIPLLAWGIRKHLAIGRAAAAAGVRERLAEQETAALHHDFSAFADGAEFRRSGHPYALDLDVFGRNSLFQMIDRTVTAPGRAWLARQLSAPLEHKERARTQVRGRLLSGDPDWCLEFRTRGNELGDRPENFRRLLAWLDRPAAINSGIERILIPLSPVLTIAGIAWMLTMDPWGIGIMAFLPALYLLNKYKDVAATEHTYTARMGDLLKGYSALLHHLESRPDGSLEENDWLCPGGTSDWSTKSRKGHTKLNGVARPAVERDNNETKKNSAQRPLVASGVPPLPRRGAAGEDTRAASTQQRSQSPIENRQSRVANLSTLSFSIAQLDLRYNPFSILLEFGGLWSIRWLRRLDRWRADHRAALPRWLNELAEADAAVSWATLRFGRPEWTDPELTDRPELIATGLGHPLLPPDGRVTNDLRLGTDGHIHLVTGSNMAGKSTWLRTVGINLVLAQAGGPVCASHLRSRPLQVWTSMRTQDDLGESTSSFYAELKRLKAIIEAVSDPERQVLFLLDEILKGTNSRDRHTGSRALIRQLVRERGAGIIATHDLELGALEAEPGSRVENFAMEVRVDGADLVFDYKLHPGVCQSFNATALMAQMGIDIPAEDIKLRHE